MNRPILLAFACCVLAAGSVRADPFEGKIDMSITTGGGQPQTIQYETRGDQVRMNVSGKGQQVSMIMDLSKEQMLILIPQRRMYLVRPLPAMGPGADSGPGNTQPTTTPRDSGLVHTGEKATILGYPCTKYTVAGQGGTVEVWATDELGNFAGFGGIARGPHGGMPGSAPPAEWEQALVGKGFFPLKVTGTDSQGHPFKLEVTSVQRESLPASEFSPPEGYQEFNMGGFMGGAGGYGH